MTERKIDRQLINDQKLVQILVSFGIPVEEWGSGEAKTIEHLLREIGEGECVLVENEGKLLRRVSVTSLDVRYHDDGGNYLLVEDRQEFTDGRVRKRGLNWSVSEKMQPDEEPVEAAPRAIYEELGIEGDLKIQEDKVFEDTKESPSYPGLESNYRRHHFNVVLDDSQYNPDGYVEKQSDKSTFFVWKKVEE